MALQADQLMRGLQLDDASMQKLELDMREEVSVCFLCVLCSFAVKVLFSLRECKSVSSLNWKCLNVRACIKVLTTKLFSSSLLFFLSEIRELSVRGRPERGWSRRDHAVHDARGRARRQVMRFISSLSSFPFEFVSLFPFVA